MRWFISQFALWVGVALFSLVAGDTILRLAYQQPILIERSLVALAITVVLMIVGLTTMLYPNTRVMSMIKLMSYMCLCFTGLVMALGPLKIRGFAGWTRTDLVIVFAGVGLSAVGVLWGLSWKKRNAAA